MPENSFNHELRSELKKIYYKTLGLRLVAGMVAFLAVAAWVFLAVVLWTSATSAPPLWQTLVVSRTAMIAIAILFAFFVLYPIVRMPRFRDLALELENRKDFKDIVEAGYEFSGREDLSDRYAPELIREVIKQAVQSVSGLQVRFLFLGRRQLMFVPIAYAALAVLALVALKSPSVLFDAGQRIASPRAAAAVHHEANLFGSPGDITVLAGTDVEVSAIDFGGSEDPVFVSFNLSEDFWKTEPTEAGEVPVENEASLNSYSYTFDGIRSSLTYFFQAGDHKSPQYRINVVHKPIVTDLNIVLTPPAYTGEKPDTLVDSGGNIQALEGTQVLVRAKANNILKNAWVRFDDKMTGRVESTGSLFEFDFVALKDGTYNILLEDELDHKTDEPLVYAIEVYKDNPPVLDVLEPGDDATLPRNLTLDLGFIASDDYGVSKAAVFYRRGGEESYATNTIPLGGDRGKREASITYPWDLSDISLFPGNYVEYYVQVEDNNVVTGPGVTKSRIFHISVPTMAELYDKVQEEDTQRADLFEEALKESSELKDRVEKLSREFKKTENLDWAQKKEIDKAISSQENIQDKLEEIQKSLEETLESLSDNKMTSQEIGEKMEEIQRLLEEIDDEALNKYIEDLQEAMEKLNPDEIQKALENLNMSSEDLLKSLERTESLLKEIQQEQQMEELVRKTQDLIEAQEELNEKTSDSDSGDQEAMDQLSEEQDALSDEADQLEQDMQEMAEGMDEQDMQEMAEQMKNTSQELSKSDPSEKMKNASKQLQQQQKQQAMENQESATDDLIGLFTRVAAMQMQMQNSSQRRAAENLQRLAKSTLEVSFRQEELTGRLREETASDHSSNISALAEQQQDYLKAISQIANELDDISKKSIAVPQNLLNLLGEAITNMQNSMSFLEQNKAFLSTASASEAVTSLNLVTMELLSACKNCSGGGGSGTGQQSAMQQLMSGQKQVLQQSQQMLGMQAAQEKMLQERLAAMQRLAGQQRSLQQLAEEIEKSMKSGDGERLLGRMDRIKEEMQEVIRDLESGVINEQTIRNEERILSRMLDAQRSIHSRDYEKKRLSIAAEDVYSNDTMAGASKRTSQQLREEIRRAMALKAPGEFEDLIKLYFRALAEEAPLTREDQENLER